jgi:glycosyltransferase involved in cell wall biosynthesis
VFVFASSCENMPSTLIEAMASGLPIACSDRGPMPEVLQDGGTYFDPEDPASIAAAIGELLQSPERRRSAAARARALAARYSWARCADETWSFLAGVARARAAKRPAQVSVDVS